MLTKQNVEQVFNQVCELKGEDFQNTSYYLMRADSLEELLETLELTKEELAGRINKYDLAAIEDHNGPIIWVDYNKQDFWFLLDDSETTIQSFANQF